MLTRTQQDMRRTGIGASEVAAILGLDPWRTPADILALKLDSRLELKETPEMRWGSVAEPYVAMDYEERYGVRLIGPLETIRHPQEPTLLATVDRMHHDHSTIVECKTHGSRAASAWGPDGTDTAPIHYVIQVIAQAIVIGGDVRAVIHALDRDSLRSHTHPVDLQSDAAKRIVGIIMTEIPKWWRRHVINRDPLPPESAPPSAEILRSRQRVPGKRVIVPAEIVEKVRQAREEAKAAEERADLASRKLIDLLGDAEIGTDESGNELCTHFRTRDTEQLDVAAFRDAMPEAYQRFLRTKPGYRRLVIRGSKSDA